MSAVESIMRNSIGMTMQVSGGQYVEGLWEPEVEQECQIRAVVVPESKTLVRDADGDRTDATLSIWSTDFFDIPEPGQARKVRVKFRNDWYLITGRADFVHWGCFYRYTATKAPQ